MQSSTNDYPYETVIGRSEDHQSLCKFRKEANDDNILARLFGAGESAVHVSMRALHQMTSAEVLNQTYKDCLSTMLIIAPSFTIPFDVSSDLDNALVVPELRSWLEGEDSSTIYLHGQSGIGKTAFSSILLRHIRKTSEMNRMTIYFSFSSQDERRSTWTDMLSSLICQILSQDPQRFTQIQDLYMAIKHRSAWTSETLCRLFDGLVAAPAPVTVYCIINAIHICKSDWKPYLSRLVNTQRKGNVSTSFKVAILGEVQPHVREGLKECSEIELTKIISCKEQMKAHVDQCISVLIDKRRFLKEFRPILQQSLYGCQTILQLLTTIDQLLVWNHKLLSTRDTIVRVLEGLPYNISSLVSEKVNSLPHWAKVSLGWILHAQRPLRLQEVASAMAFAENEGTVRLVEGELSLDMSGDIERVLGFLVKVENNEILIYHEDIRQSLTQVMMYERQQNISRHATSNASHHKPLFLDHWIITRLLVGYLSSTTFIEQATKALRRGSWGELRTPMSGMMAYALRFWPAHYKKAKDQGTEPLHMYDILQNSTFVRTWWELSSQMNVFDLPPNICAMDPLYLASYLGFPTVVIICLTRDKSSLLSLATRLTAATFASWTGHLDIVKTLLQDEDDTAVVEKHSLLTDILINASIRGHEDILKFLIGKISRSSYDYIWDPNLICQAAELGYEAQAEIFIAAGAVVNVMHNDTTPLQYAARQGHARIVHLLLSHSADPNFETRIDSPKPLLTAAHRGYSIVVRLLLKSNANSGCDDEEGHTPLHLAARGGYEDIIELLLHHGANPTKEDHRGQTALHLACLNGHSKVVKYIIDASQGSTMDALDRDGYTPLRIASREGHVSTVETLLDNGAKPDLPGFDKHTPLYSAVVNGHEATARILLARMNRQLHVNDMTEVLIEAAMHGWLQICRKCASVMADQGADATIEKKCTVFDHTLEYETDEIAQIILCTLFRTDLEEDVGEMLLDSAVLAGRGQIVRILLDWGVQPHGKNFRNQTLVSQLAGLDASTFTDNHGDVVETLLEAGLVTDDTDRSGKSALHHAAMSGNLKLIKLLLEYKADARIRDKYSRLPIHYSSNRETSQFFIDLGIDPQDCDEDGSTPFHVAAKYACTDVMTLLWKISPTLVDRRVKNGRPPLHLAYYQEESVRWLLAHGAEINAKDKSGDTVLMRATRSEEDKVVELLLLHHADPSIRDHSGQTALHHAAEYGNSFIIRSILEKTPEVISFQDDEERTAIHVAVEEQDEEAVRALLSQQLGTTINLKNEDGNTALLLAVENRRVGAGQNLLQIVELLIDSGADLELRNNVGQTALLLAITKGDENVWKMLIGRPNSANINAGGGVHPTALSLAAWQGDGTLVQQLLDCGANVNGTGGMWNTALQAAAAGGFVDLVVLLLANRADARITGGMLGTALTAAVYAGSFTLLQRLYDSGAPVTVQDDQGRTAMHFAAWQGSLETMEWLEGKGSSYSIKDYQGRTLLHHAAMGGSFEVVKQFLEDEASRDLNVEDEDGWTPLHWACRNDSNEDVVELLIKAGADIFQSTPKDWTPWNIAAFHHAKALFHLFKKLKIASPVKEGKTFHRAASHGAECDGCHQAVRRLLTHFPLPKHFLHRHCSIIIHAD